MKSLKKSISIILVMAMMVSMGSTSGVGLITADAESTSKSLEEYKEILNYTAEYQGYGDYLESNDTSKRPEDTYEINAADYVNSEGMTPEVLDNYEGMDGESV